jgi:Ras-related protein Rab-8A
MAVMCNWALACTASAGISGSLSSTRAAKDSWLHFGKLGLGQLLCAKRAVADFYNPGQEPPVGPSFSAKTIQLDHCLVTLWIWDPASQERFRTLGPLYYHGAQAIVIVFSLVARD